MWESGSTRHLLVQLTCVLSMLTQIEAAKAYLHQFSGQIGIPKFREIFFGKNHGWYHPGECRCHFRLFKDEDDFFDCLQIILRFFTAERDGQTYYFYPIQARLALLHLKIQAFTLNGG